MNFTKSGLKKIQETEDILIKRRYRSVWSKSDQMIPFDTYTSLWVSKGNGRSILIALSSLEENLDILTINELIPIEINKIY